MTNGNDSIHNSEQAPQDGLTKREYVAAMAMQALLSHYGHPPTKKELEKLAFKSVEITDALIEQLNKQL